MRARLFLTLVPAILILPVPAARAQQPATGMTIQIRMPVTTISSLASTALGNPQFLIGRRLDHGGFGLGLGFSRFAWHSEFEAGGFKNENRVSGTLFQASPAVWFDFWRAPDGATVGNVLVMAGYGRAFTNSEYSNTGPLFSSNGEDSDTGNVFGFGVGFGGDHFLGPNFSIGVEAGVQGAIISGFEPDDSVQQGVSTALCYAALRASIVY